MLLIWSGFQLTSRLSAAQSFTMWDIAALRYAGAFLAILPIVWFRGLPRIPLRRSLAIVLFAGFGFPLGAYGGFQFAPAAHGAVILAGLLPFFIAAAWWLAFDEPWGRQKLVSLALVAAGILLLALDAFGSRPGAWRGDLILLAGGMSWAGYMWLIRKWRVGALDATCAIALFAGPIYLPVWWFLLPSRMAEIAPGLIAFHMAYQGCLSVVLAGLLFTQAVVLIGGPQTSAVTAGVPAVVALGAWPLLGETLGWSGAGGIVLVTLGMIAGVAGPAPKAAGLRAPGTLTPTR